MFEAETFLSDNAVLLLFSATDTFSTLIDLHHNTQLFPPGHLHIVFPDLLPLRRDDLSPITETDGW